MFDGRPMTEGIQLFLIIARLIEAVYLNTPRRALTRPSIAVIIIQNDQDK